MRWDYFLSAALSCILAMMVSLAAVLADVCICFAHLQKRKKMLRSEIKLNENGREKTM